MKKAIVLLEHIKQALITYDAFSDKVSEIDHEVYKKANENGMLGSNWQGGISAEVAAERLHGYLIALEEQTDNNKGTK